MEQKCQKGSSVSIVMTDPFSAFDMVDSAGILDAEFARHGTKVPKRLVCVNSYDRPLFRVHTSNTQMDTGYNTKKSPTTNSSAGRTAFSACASMT
jgi:hypothetical protein